MPRPGRRRLRSRRRRRRGHRNRRRAAVGDPSPGGPGRADRRRSAKLRDPGAPVHGSYSSEVSEFTPGEPARRGSIVVAVLVGVGAVLVTGVLQGASWLTEQALL